MKPANVMIDRRGRVVLTDFGIARFEGSGGLTRTGEIVGSPHYLSPERVTGHRPGPESDLWALGATLYAAVEGQSPFMHSTTAATLQAVMANPLPEPVHAGPLAPVIAALMSKEPAARATGDEAVRLLEEVAQGRTPPTPTLISPSAGAPDRAPQPPHPTAPTVPLQPPAEPGLPVQEPYGSGSGGRSAQGYGSPQPPPAFPTPPTPPPDWPGPAAQDRRRRRCRWPVIAGAALAAALLGGGAAAVLAAQSHHSGTAGLSAPSGSASPSPSTAQAALRRAFQQRRTPLRRPRPPVQIPRRRPRSPRRARRRW